MAEHDDAEPNVISLVGRSQRAHPAETEDDADAERREHTELEEEIAGIQRDLARGEPAARDLLTGARNRHAMGTFLLGDHAAAFAEWREIIDDDPAPPDLLLTRAIFHKAAGDPGAAAADYERAAQISPLDAEIYLLRGHAAYLEHAGRHAEAVRVHDRRIAIEPTLGLSYFQRGEARLHLGDDEGTLRASLADFDKASELGDDDPDLPEAHARLLEQLGARP